MGRSETAIIRDENIRLHGEMEGVKEFCASVIEVCREAIALQAGMLKREKERGDRLQKALNRMETENRILRSWNGRTSESRGQAQTRKEFEEQARAHEAAKKAEENAQTATGEAGEQAEEAGEQAEEAGLGQSESVKKTIGGQLGHLGVSRMGKCKYTLYFTPKMCRCCGGTDMYVVGNQNKRVIGCRCAGDMASYNAQEGEPHCCMHVKYEMKCRACGETTLPHTLDVVGSAFMPRERGIIRTYGTGTQKIDSIGNDEERERGIIRTYGTGGTSISVSKRYMRELHDTSISTGAISNCMSAMADQSDGDVVCQPHEKPVVIDDDSLRVWRGPLEPARGRAHADSPYAKNDVLLTTRSTTWTQFILQPDMVRIPEVASMESCVVTDETPHQVGKKSAQVLAAITKRVTMLRVEEDKKADTVRRFLEWAVHRLDISDGADLYRWHKADHQRCWVHVLRKVQDAAMRRGLDSEEYIRWRLLLDAYYQAKRASERITEMVGHEMKSACDLDMVARMGLADAVNAEIAKIRGVIDMAAAMIDDSAATHIKNAADGLACVHHASRSPASQQRC